MLLSCISAACGFRWPLPQHRTRDPAHIEGLSLPRSFTRTALRWVAAPYVEGTLVVNLGDLVKVWTNEVYVSNLHRVANRTGRERYSIPTFFNLDYDTPVRCLPLFMPSVGEPKHAPIKSGEYLVSRFAAVQKYKTPAALAAATT